MNEVVETAAFERNEFGALDRFLRQRFIALMAKLRHGQIVVRDDLGRFEVGTRSESTCALVQLWISDPGFYRAIAANGSVGAGEAYMAGYWHCDNLVGLMQMLVRNRDTLDAMDSGWARIGASVLRVLHAMKRNSRAGSRRNIAAHYDLGNKFFSLFLSPDLMYSSALWADPQDTLETASSRKLQRICRKLDLQPSDHVLEIGTGWGGFAIHAAKNYGCRVTTTTISREQFALASQRTREAGVDDRVTLLQQDYRDLAGSYDKLVSIEMIEAIGAEYMETYFGKIAALLKPSGSALLQAITIEDHRYAQALRSVDFIKHHVFPGCFIPSIEAMLRAKTRACDLALIHLQDFGASYARTLEAWRERFLARLPEVRAQGYDQGFIRMWEFYLAYCEGGFRERSIGVSHLLFAKPGHRTEQASAALPHAADTVQGA